MSAGSGTLDLSGVVTEGEVLAVLMSRGVTGEGIPFLLFEFREAKLEDSPDGELWREF